MASYKVKSKREGGDGSGAIRRSKNGAMRSSNKGCPSFMACAFLKKRGF
jgi:hypothetical protein